MAAGAGALGDHGRGHGRLVTLDPERPELEDGALYIGAEELIHAVQSNGPTR